VIEGSLMGISVAVAAVAAVGAYWFYLRKPELPGLVVSKLGKVYDLVANKYYVDEFYDRRIIQPLVGVSQALWAHVDVNFIDKMTFWVGDIVVGAGRAFKNLQNGNVQSYALYMVFGIIAALYFVFYGV
jgi:NADH-quinone oxidoreductase subunit L